MQVLEKMDSKEFKALCRSKKALKVNQHTLTVPGDVKWAVKAYGLVRGLTWEEAAIEILRCKGVARLRKHVVR